MDNLISNKEFERRRKLRKRTCPLDVGVDDAISLEAFRETKNSTTDFLDVPDLQAIDHENIVEDLERISEDIENIVGIDLVNIYGADSLFVFQDVVQKMPITVENTKKDIHYLEKDELCEIVETVLRRIPGVEVDKDISGRYDFGGPEVFVEKPKRRFYDFRFNNTMCRDHLRYIFDEFGNHIQDGDKLSDMKPGSLTPKILGVEKSKTCRYESLFTHRKSQPPFDWTLDFKFDNYSRPKIQVYHHNGISSVSINFKDKRDVFN